MKSIKVAAAIIRSISKEGDPLVLAAQRGYGEYKDWWEFPGGKIEDGETAEEALIREIHEELAADIAVEKHLITVEYDLSLIHI